MDRDPACTRYIQPLLYFKGFQAVQAYRLSHHLWANGHRTLAVALQSQVSQVFAVDIHPAARIGTGVLIDHGTAVVIGETAVVEENVSMLHVRAAPRAPGRSPPLAPRWRAAEMMQWWSPCLERENLSCPATATHAGSDSRRHGVRRGRPAPKGGEGRVDRSGGVPAGEHPDRRRESHRSREPGDPGRAAGDDGGGGAGPNRVQLQDEEAHRERD